MEYILYHIPKRKEWGCTTNLQRRLKNTPYSLSDVSELRFAYDIDTAADMEAQLNIEYGYGWNSSRDYRKMVQRASLANLTQTEKKLKSSSKQGIIQGKKNLESGHWLKVCSIGGLTAKENRKNDLQKQKHHANYSAKGGLTQSQIVYVCPNCNKQGKGNAMKRHHFDNCKNKNKL